MLGMTCRCLLSVGLVSLICPPQVGLGCTLQAARSALLCKRTKELFLLGNVVESGESSSRDCMNTVCNIFMAVGVTASPVSPRFVADSPWLAAGLRIGCARSMVSHLLEGPGRTLARTSPIRARTRASDGRLVRSRRPSFPSRHQRVSSPPSEKKLPWRWMGGDLAIGGATCRGRRRACRRTMQSNAARATANASAAFLKAPVMRAAPETYAKQLEEKRKVLAALLRWPVERIQVHESRPTHYRARAEFRVWHAQEKLFYAMFGSAEPGARPAPVQVEEFSIGSLLMNALMVPLMEHIKDNQTMRKKLFQCNFHTTMHGEAMVTMVYHRKLDQTWQAEAERIRDTLAEDTGMSRDALSLIGRSKKQKIVLGNDFVVEKFRIDGTEYSYKQFEGCFSQPNAGMCQHMLKWAKEVTRNLQGKHASARDTQGWVWLGSQATSHANPIEATRG